MFFTDTCLDIQCEKHSKCKIFSTDFGENIPTCTCDAIQDPNRLAYKPACSKLENTTFVNKIHLRKVICKSNKFIFAESCSKEEGNLTNCYNVCVEIVLILFACLTCSDNTNKTSVIVFDVKI